MMNQEMSVTSSQSSEPGLSENESGLVLARPSGPSLSQAQTQISLFFALCSKAYKFINSIINLFVYTFCPFEITFFLKKNCFMQKPSLLRVVFDVYGKTPKVVKQVILLCIYGLTVTCR